MKLPIRPAARPFAFRSLAVALAAAALVSTSAAQAPQEAGEPSTGTFQEDDAAAERLAKDLNRIVHLTNGSVLRGRARLVNDQWEVRTRGEWTALPPELVDRVKEERQVLAQARELERKVGRDDLVRRISLAHWMLGAGLVSEGLLQVDKVLLAEPDQADALKLLADPPVRLGAFANVGHGTDELLRAAASASPSMRELAILQLEGRGKSQGQLAELQGALGSHSVRIRTLAARALRRMYPGEGVRELMSRSVLDGSQDVRLEAALALRDAHEEAVLLPIIRALDSQSTRVRENAAQALGNMAYPAAVEPLMARLATIAAPQSSGAYRSPGAYIFVGKQFAYVQDFDVEVAQGSSIADPIINTLTEGSVLDVRVHGTHEYSVTVESRRLRTSLAQLTGADPGNSNRSWLEWWDENKGKWNVPVADDATGRTRAR